MKEEKKWIIREESKQRLLNDPIWIDRGTMLYDRLMYGSEVNNTPLSSICLTVSLMHSITALVCSDLDKGLPDMDYFELSKVFLENKEEINELAQELQNLWRAEIQLRQSEPQGGIC